MRTGKLNVKQVEAVLRGRGINGEAPKNWYGDGGGLALVIKRRDPEGRPQAASWMYAYMILGVKHEVGLGSAWTVDLAEAREEAQELRKQTSGKHRVDVLAEKRADKEKQRAEAAVVKAQAMTFRACAEAFLRAHEEKWRNPKHRAQWRSTLETVHTAFGDVPVGKVDTGMIIKVLEPIWLTKTETASRIRGRIEAVLDYAKARGYRDGENAARWSGHLETLLPLKSAVAKVRHHKALPYQEIGAFTAELRQQEGIAARALEFLLLTWARTGEVIGAHWDEIEGDVWRIPGERMKAGKEHRIPLSARALQIITDMRKIRDRRPSEFVFQGMRDGAPLSNMSMLMLLRRMQHGELTVHGFRSAAADWCAEQTAFPAELREMALAHAVGNKTEAAYRRGDMFQKRRQLAEAWARYCAKPAQHDSGKVVAIGGS
jgi:integrase